MDFMAQDPEVFGAIHNEEERQEHNIELIASENIVSPAVRAAQGSVLTNSILKVILAIVIMVVINTLMWLRISPLIALRNCLGPNLQMYSRIPVHRQIWPRIAPF